MPTEHVLQIKVTLRHVKPQVWRRILVPDNYYFWDLHVAIQDAMGWLDSHLHEFVARDPLSGDKVHIGIPLDESLNPTLAGWRVPVSLFLNLASRRIDYAYDFGDGWSHSVVLEQIFPRPKDLTLPACTGGRNRCPPEDCGGPPGYERLLAVLANPRDEEHAEMLEWVGGAFDPKAFNPEGVTFDDPDERFALAFSDE